MDHRGLSAATNDYQRPGNACVRRGFVDAGVPSLSETAATNVNICYVRTIRSSIG